MSPISQTKSSASKSDALLTELIDQVSARLEADEPVDLDAFIAAHPERSEALRKVLPALAVLADLGRSAAEGLDDGLTSPRPDAKSLGELGDYRILREIGRGGMGVVYEATQISLNRRVALKVLPFAGALDAQHLARFRLEAQAAAQLHHTNIVPVFAVGTERGVHYYAMQFIEGKTLAALIRELRAQSGLPARGESEAADKVETASTLAYDLASGRFEPVPTEAPAMSVRPKSKSVGPSNASPTRDRSFFRTVANLGLQAAEALEYAHRFGILHRDIKPANLLVDIHGNLWVTDFGLARFGDDASLTMTGDLLGTLRYMSPEQALGHPAVIDQRSDVYGLGVTLYELLTLQPAFDGQDRHEILRRIAFEEPRPPRKLNPSVPRELDTILLTAMAKEPAGRYVTAHELSDDLLRFLEHRPIKARPPTLIESAANWSRRHRGIVGSTLVALMLAVAGLAISIVLIEQQRRIAVTNMKAANEQRDLVAARSRDLTAAYDTQEQQLYTSLVNRAQTEWSANNLALTEQLLDECPPSRRNWEWYYCQRLCHLERLTLRGSGQPFLSLAFSPDSRWIMTAANSDYTGSGAGEWAIWDATTGRVIENRTAHGVCKVAVDPLGTRVAVGSSTGPGGPSTVNLWKTTSNWPPRLAREPDRVLRLHHWMRDLAFSPNGRQLATISHVQIGSIVEHWDLDTGRRLHLIDISSSKALAVAFRPDGIQFATGCFDGTVRLWDATTGGAAGVLRGHAGEVFGVAYSRDGHRLVTCGWDETVRVWDSASGNPIHVLRGHDSFVRSVAFSPDGTRIVSASDDHTGRLWDAAIGKEVGILRGHTRFVRDVAFSADGRRIGSASEDGTVKLWDATAADPARTISHGAWVARVAFFPNGSTLASACWDGSVRLWDVADGRELGQPLRMFASQILCLAIRFDGTSLAASDHSAVIRLWDPTTGRLLHDLRGHQGPTLGLAFRPDGRQFASTSTDGTLRLWDSETGHSSVFFRAPSGVESIAVVYRPDGQQVAAALTDSTVRILDAASGVERLRLEALITDIMVGVGSGILAYDPAGRWIAACSNSGDRVPGEVRVFDATTGRPALTLRGHTSNVVAVTFSPDGSRIATASFDQTVKLWDAATGREVFTIRGHKGGVLSVAFSPDGQRLATGSIDHTLKIWDAPRDPRVPLTEELRANDPSRLRDAAPALPGQSKSTPSTEKENPNRLAK